MTTPSDNNGPATGTWAWAIQRELDNLQRTLDSRYTDLATRIDRVVSSTEYGADKRAADQQYRNTVDRITNIEKDVELFKKETGDRIELLRITHESDIDKIGLLISAEKTTREVDRRTDQEAYRQQREKDMEEQTDKKRYIMAAILIPIFVALIPTLIALFQK